ncbi:MAG: hypothetical protein ABSG42_08725, partial [Nitrospirota bacterium]
MRRGKTRIILFILLAAFVCSLLMDGVAVTRIMRSGRESAGPSLISIDVCGHGSGAVPEGFGMPACIAPVISYYFAVCRFFPPTPEE